MYRHARIPNPRNGWSEAFLPYSMPPMDEDEGARTGPSSRRPWRQRWAWRGKQRIRVPPVNYCNCNVRDAAGPANCNKKVDLTGCLSCLSSVLAQGTVHHSSLQLPHCT